MSTITCSFYKNAEVSLMKLNLKILQDVAAYFNSNFNFNLLSGCLLMQIFPIPTIESKKQQNNDVELEI